MIISIKKLKILAVIITLVVIPYIGLNLINLSLNNESQPTAKTVSEATNSQTTVQNNLQPNLSEGDSFFSEYRMERERVRGKELGLLKDIANSPSNNQKARDAASMKLIQLTDQTEKEMQIETMIKSKGLQDCAIILNASNATVMIEDPDMEINYQEQIRKMVSKATGFAEKNITVINHLNY